MRQQGIEPETAAPGICIVPNVIIFIPGTSPDLCCIRSGAASSSIMLGEQVVIAVSLQPEHDIVIIVRLITVQIDLKDMVAFQIQLRDLLRLLAELFQQRQKLWPVRKLFAEDYINGFQSGGETELRFFPLLLAQVADDGIECIGTVRKRSAAFNRNRTAS